MRRTLCGAAGAATLGLSLLASLGILFIFKYFELIISAATIFLFPPFHVAGRRSFYFADR